MADNRPGAGGYHEHVAGFFTHLDTDYATGLHYHGGGVWYVQRGDQGTWFQSTGNPNYAGIGAQFGTETSNNGNDACGHENQIAFEHDGGTTQNLGLPGANYYNGDNPPSYLTSTNGTISFDFHTNC